MRPPEISPTGFMSQLYHIEVFPVGLPLHIDLPSLVTLCIVQLCNDKCNDKLQKHFKSKLLKCNVMSMRSVDK